MPELMSPLANFLCALSKMSVLEHPLLWTTPLIFPFIPFSHVCSMHVWICMFLCVGAHVCRECVCPDAQGFRLSCGGPRMMLGIFHFLHQGWFSLNPELAYVASLISPLALGIPSPPFGARITGQLLHPSVIYVVLVMVAWQAVNC